MEAGYIACKHLALCLNEYVYNVCRTIPYRLFREKLQVLIPLCLLGCCGVDAICKAHKRTVFGHVVLEWINQGFPLHYSCCLAAWRGLSCSHQSVLSSFCRKWSFSSRGGAVWLWWWSRCWSVAGAWRGGHCGQCGCRPQPCTLLWACKNMVVVCYWGLHAHWHVDDTPVTEHDTWKMGDSELCQQIPRFESWALGKL